MFLFATYSPYCCALDEFVACMGSCKQTCIASCK